jgi:hypothetical protein
VQVENEIGMIPSPRDHSERVVLGERLIRKPVLPPGDAIERSFPDKSREDLAVDAMSGGLPGSGYPHLPGKGQGFFGSRLWHVLNCTHLSLVVNSFTHHMPCYYSASIRDICFNGTDVGLDIFEGRDWVQR